MKIAERHKAKALRADGHSLKEIAAMLGVAKSSASFWVRDVPLSQTAKQRLLTKIKLGQFNAAENKKARTRATEKHYLEKAIEEVKGMGMSATYQKLLCALIYWCEGVKDPHHGMAFINSDQRLMKSFLRLLRESFVIDEKRFRPLLHLHEYHNISAEVDFWSKITNINKSQFRRSYIKPHTGKRIREGYHGCLSLRYFSTDLARQLLAFGKAFFEMGA